jgi:uncharacterized phage protein (TIGR02218 family)
MKAASSTLGAFLNDLRNAGGGPICSGDLFTIWLATGSVISVTDLDSPVAWNGRAYLANSILFAGLRYKCALGLSVDSQQATIFARSADTVAGVPFMQALQQGMFEGAIVQREKAFFRDWTLTGGALVPIGAAIMFKGRVAAVDQIGRVSATVTVSADTVFLDIDMPRRLWSAQCTHVLYDPGCGLAKGTFSANGAVGSGATKSRVPWSSAAAGYAQGTIAFTSGANAGIARTIKAADASGLTLAYPLTSAPAAGDTFTAAQGCDHTQATCQAKFNNLSRFRGYPYVPPPQIMTGPLSSTYTANAKGK